MENILNPKRKTKLGPLEGRQVPWREEPEEAQEAGSRLGLDLGVGTWDCSVCENAWSFSLQFSGCNVMLPLI